MQQRRLKTRTELLDDSENTVGKSEFERFVFPAQEGGGTNWRGLKRVRRGWKEVVGVGNDKWGYKNGSTMAKIRSAKASLKDSSSLCSREAVLS